MSVTFEMNIILYLAAVDTSLIFRFELLTQITSELFRKIDIPVSTVLSHLNGFQLVENSNAVNSYL